MTKEERISLILDLLDEHYPTDDKCFLNHSTAYELLFSTILSAQCTDDRVNIVTKDLFKKYQSLEDFARADLYEMEEAIRSTGFYHNKAKNIIQSANMLLEIYHGEIPSDINDLTKLAGVGRKTANVVRSHIFNIPSIVVDTHVKRISFKLGLTKNTVPEKVEFDLMKILPQEHWIRYNTQIITHGRKICKARTPLCHECFFNIICENEQI